MYRRNASFFPVLRPFWRAALVLTALSAVALLPVTGAAQPLPAERAFEPVVVTGAALEPLAGATPQRAVAFRYEDGAWVQVPVQVDEREEINLEWVYNGRDDSLCATGAWCIDRGPVYKTVYMDEGTFVGPDSNPFVDEDDEVVFMARDAGERAPAGTLVPPGIRGSHGIEVEVALPDGTQEGYVYLFWHDGRYAADAGRSYVSYDFRLLSGGYHDTYNVPGIPFNNQTSVGDRPGANPEDTEVVTPFYRRHFLDRWMEDEVEIRAGGATGVDLLDRWKIQFEPGRCARTEYTGSAGRGAFIANRSGPVRAIRSAMGFNSGPYMQQDLFFYERYVAGTFYFRGHPVDKGPMAYNDYSAAAAGMHRYTNLDPEGFLLDGEPEDATEGVLEWEVVHGEQGALASVFEVRTDVPDVVVGSYYEDEAPAPVMQCTGDEALYGASGLRLFGAMPNTDPSLDDDLYVLEYDRHQLYGSPAFLPDSAQAFIAAVRNPLAVTADAFAVVLDADPDPPPGVDPPPEGPVFLGVPRPNPSARSARISYWLEEEVPVHLAVYDLAGRRLVVLDEGSRAAGYHDVGLPSRRFPVGTYVVRLDTPLGGRSVTFVRN